MTINDTNVLLRTLAKFQEQLDEVDEGLPTGLIGGLEQLLRKLEIIPDPSVPFSEVDALTLLGIKTAPLYLLPDVTLDIESLGSSTSDPEGEFALETLKELLGLVKHHVSLVTEAGCRILINIILLRVVSAVSTAGIDVNIVPEFSIAKTTLSGNSISFKFGHVVDLLLTNCRFLLDDPTLASGNQSEIDGPMTSTFFEAKQDNHTCVERLYNKRQTANFFIYSVDENGGDRVACSEQFSLGSNLEGQLLVQGLLTDWVENTKKYDQKFFAYE
ncbi:hypothetical protein EV702DRAFT_1205343 [Suillus placidus]|uniref:Uncharacterized protein n=1 Tax=Suillus placidus TaxID=48579 RepID=A0A9P6ZFJ8_9AGAM|nr:hypothetical protein EV702DRAFT_1205343 [Suillus placidus]